MKSLLFSFVVLALLLAASPSPAFAQTDSPPAEAATGVVSGKIIDQNKGIPVTGSLDVMLHVWDQQYVDIGMEHGQSQADGTFQFSNVEFDPQRLYAVMATFEDVTYFSDMVPGPTDSNEIKLNVPVIETTSDLAAVRIDQLHLLFDFAEDGLETAEIYVLSNRGDRTVKDAVKLDNGQAATLRFPLPSDADFIFFQPDDSRERFIKFAGGFADSGPLKPGEGSAQFLVQYLVPYSSGRTFTYTAPVSVDTLDFLLPEGSGVTLEGQGLSGPQPYTLQSGASYQRYSYGTVQAGETIKVTFKGKPKGASSKTTTSPNLPIALGGAILGLTMAGLGIWWWYRPEEEETETAPFEPADQDLENLTFDDLVEEIVRLDEAYEHGLIEREEHRQQRRMLLLEAKKNFPEEFK